MSQTIDGSPWGDHEDHLFAGSATRHGAVAEGPFLLPQPTELAYEIAASQTAPPAAPSTEIIGQDKLASAESPLGEVPERDGLAEVERELDPYVAIRPALSPEHAHLTADEIAIRFGRMPAVLTLHHALATPAPQQAVLAVLLGSAGRRSTRIHGHHAPIPAYLRALSRLCREAAEQAEQDSWHGRVAEDEAPPLPEHPAVFAENGHAPPAAMSPFPPQAFADPLTEDQKLKDAFNAAISTVKSDHAFAALPAVDDLPIIMVAINDDKSRPAIGHHVKDMLYAGSMLKIAAMYAAFQLRHVVNELAATLDPAKVSDGLTLFAAIGKEFDGQILKASDLISKSTTVGRRAPQYHRIFTASKNASGKWTVAFRADPDPKFDFDGHLKKMVVDSHNPSAGFCIQALGLSLIAGLLQKAGLFDPSSKHGIWLAGDYLMTSAAVRAAHASADGDADGKEEFDLGISGWSEVRVPSSNDGPSKQAATCIDVARLFVLLIDGKLVPTALRTGTDTANDEMLDLLGQAVTGAGAPSIIARFPSPPAPFDIRQSKIGVGTLGSSGNCIRNPTTGHTNGCVLAEAMIVQQASLPHRTFVVVWQNVKDAANHNFDEIERIRRLILKTMHNYHP